MDVSAIINANANAAGSTNAGAGAGSRYAGRLAPSPTGLLHLGHARTFWVAAERARAAGGDLFLRNDDLDGARCRAEFVTAMIEDLRWLGLRWREPVVSQSGRAALYREALEQLRAAGVIYPCSRSRRDVEEAAGAPHEARFFGARGQGEGAMAALLREAGARESPKAVSPHRAGAPRPAAALQNADCTGEHDEPVFPREWRPPTGAAPPRLPRTGEPVATNWRFRVPDDEVVCFTDNALGPQSAVAGRDFGDFLVWRRDNTPSYQLACAVDDAAMGITEVVRGADLVKSTFRQILVLRALGAAPPRYFHCPLMGDDAGRRLAKRHDSLSLRALRGRGVTPGEILRGFEDSVAALKSPANGPPG